MDAAVTMDAAGHVAAAAATGCWSWKAITVEGERGTAGTTPIDWIPDEILLLVLSQLNDKMLMIWAPQVCKRWRKLCPEINNVHLDFLGGW